MENGFDTDIKFVAGVGEARAKLLAQELGIRTAGDLLRHYPFRYIDRTRIYPIAEITDGAGLSYVQFRARVTGFAYAGAGRKRRFTVFVRDASGAAELTWFHSIKWIESRVEQGREYIVFGRPSFYRGELRMAHPELETVEQALSRRAESGLQGIYPSTEKLSNVLGAKGMYRIVCNAWALLAERIADPLPEALRTQYGLVPLREAFYNIHFPQSQEGLRQAQFRLKFDELLGVQLDILSRRTARLAKAGGFLFTKVGPAFRTFYDEKLPFPLTGAQKRVIREIRQDTVTGFQMNRLLQGDVGSGKTLVALLSMLLAVDNGYQACMMAPTEILARQHYATIRRMLDGVGVEVAVLTGASKAAERRAALEGIASGAIDILVGTHALIEEKVRFADLGFVVIDEQHRFGVEQREALRAKSERDPHLLVMTATPIPRTAAMTWFGDLDISWLTELPGGRKPIRTFVIPEADAHMMADMFWHIRRRIDAGERAYIICPRIEPSDAEDGGAGEPDAPGLLSDAALGDTGEPRPPLHAVVEIAQRLRSLPQFNGVRLCTLTGRDDDATKAQVMADFESGETPVMVATTVVEVGVDVPQASCITIFDADRYGLSQLHQLRGRVGRGGTDSWAFLVSRAEPGTVAQERLEVIAGSLDGAEIASRDLELRGAGDVLGDAQSGGKSSLKLLRVVQDARMIADARASAQELLAHDPDLAGHVQLAGAVLDFTRGNEQYLTSN